MCIRDSLSNSQASSAASNADGLPASGSRGNIYTELGQGVWRLSGGLLTKDRVAGGVFRVYAADSGNDTLLGTSSMAADVDLAIDGVPTGKSHMHLAPTPPIRLELATADMIDILTASEAATAYENSHLTTHQTHLSLIHISEPTRPY